MDKVIRTVQLQVSVAVESTARVLGSDVIRMVEIALQSGVEHAGEKMHWQGIHAATLNKPMPVISDEMADCQLEDLKG